MWEEKGWKGLVREREMGGEGMGYDGREEKEGGKVRGPSGWGGERRGKEGVLELLAFITHKNL